MTTPSLKTRTPSTKQRRIDMLTEALKQIGRETRGYSQFSQMGSLNAIASRALTTDYKHETGIARRRRSPCTGKAGEYDKPTERGTNGLLKRQRRLCVFL